MVEFVTDPKRRHRTSTLGCSQAAVIDNCLLEGLRSKDPKAKGCRFVEVKGRGKSPHPEQLFMLSKHLS